VEAFTFLLLLCLECSYLGAWLAGQRGRSDLEGFILGFLFGPFGLMIELFLPQIVVPDPLPGDQKRRFEDISVWHRHRLRAKVESRRRERQRIREKSNVQNRA
jgi:hypothetical protein